VPASLEVRLENSLRRKACSEAGIAERAVSSAKVIDARLT
jgi:hypothetical protein